MALTRRDFLRGVALAGAAVAIGPAIGFAEPVLAPVVDKKWLLWPWTPCGCVRDTVGPWTRLPPDRMTPHWSNGKMNTGKHCATCHGSGRVEFDGQPWIPNRWDRPMKANTL